MDDAWQRDGNAATARIIRQFAPSRIERQLLAQVFELVSHGPPILTKVSAERSAQHRSMALDNIGQATEDSRVISIPLVGRDAA